MSGLRDAAVLVPVFRDPRGITRLVMVRRAEGGLHGGQLAFPGGNVDPADASLRDTALREAQEEIGLPPDAVTVLEALPVLVTRTTGYRIAPFLGRIRPPERWLPDPREVAEVLELDVHELAHPASFGVSMEQFAGWPDPVRIEFYRVGPYRLWGASYHILQPLLARLVAGEWER